MPSDAFDTAWSLFKEKCDKTNRIFRNNQPSIILVCNREKGHEGSCEWEKTVFEYDDRDMFPPMGGGNK